MQALKNPSYLQSSTTFLLFFASWGIWWSFFQIWLTNEEQGLGFSGAQVGTLYSVNSIGTLIIMLFYGTTQDRLGLKRNLAIFASAIMALIGPFMIWVYRPLLETNFMLGVVVGAIVLSFGFLAAAGLLEAISERYSRVYNFEYGQARMWGSIGYALVALIAGFLFTITPNINFWLGSLFGLLCLLVQLFWKNAPIPADATALNTSQSTPGVREMVGLLRIKSLWAIIGFVFLSWTFYTVFDQQMFPEFYTNLFDTQERGQQVYGVLNSVQVFLEALMMGLVPLIMRRYGVKTTLMMGIGVMLIRILGCAIFTDPVIISLVKMLHAPEVALCILPVFRYFTLHFNPALSATLYMVGFQIASQIGNVILSPVLGSVRDAIGYQPTFYLIAGVVALAFVYGLFILKNDDEQVDGDPFIREPKKSRVAA
ncbi:galactoside permease [Rothia nasimurium]|uniref:Galactoside permease n=1 Tax=Rothia nasimurium TaxID=85336 RepID=A0A1Y1RN22_9MICC|nr:MFS transporter [Rothia nasimurium]ORC16012.1 galactoside permease [Rothia nasimurium]